MDLIFSCLCAYVLVLVVYIKQYNYFNYEISSKTTNHSYHHRMKTWYEPLTNAEHMKIGSIHFWTQTYRFAFYIGIEHKHFKASNSIVDLHFSHLLSSFHGFVVFVHHNCTILKYRHTKITLYQKTYCRIDWFQEMNNLLSKYNQK